MNTRGFAPWKLADTDKATIIEDRNGDAIAVVDLPGMAEADRSNLAKMIAAPDLLAALELLYFNCKHGNGSAAWDKAFDKARAAIAKAKGE